MVWRKTRVRECGAYCGVKCEGQAGVHQGKAPFDKRGSINTWLKVELEALKKQYNVGMEKPGKE